MEPETKRKWPTVPEWAGGTRGSVAPWGNRTFGTTGTMGRPPYGGESESPSPQSPQSPESYRIQEDSPGFIPVHGGYQNLRSFQKAQIVYDATVCFCARFLSKRDRTYDQMVQAARSGKQNIVEGSQVSGTSKEFEIKLTNVARASLEELVTDYRDFLRTGGLRLWEKNSREAIYVRRLGGRPDATYESFRTFLETRPPEVVANIIICLIRQTTYLLDHQIKRLEQDFIKEGGLRERMSSARRAEMEKQWKRGSRGR